MGSTVSLMSAINMFQLSSLAIFIPFAFAVPPPPEYPTPAPTQEYNPDIGQTNVGGYGVNKNPYCHMVEKVVFENQCEPYTETTCWTQNEEDCLPVEYNNCTGVIETDIERVCFDVNELVCDLVEAIHYETLEETYQVQRCFTGKDRVCDTTYKIDMTTKDDYQCTNVETPNCFIEEKIINDVTCTNSVEFNCKRDKSTKNDGYGPKGVVCSRKPTQNCYNIPRKIQVEVCKTDVHRYCEKFSNIFPFPVEEQNCHFEPKKICDQCEKKSLRPVCEMQQRLECIYTPKEECRDEDKQYCHKVERVELV